MQGNITSRQLGEVVVKYIRKNPGGAHLNAATNAALASENAGPAWSRGNDHHDPKSVMASLRVGLGFGFFLASVMMARSSDHVRGWIASTASTSARGCLISRTNSSSALSSSSRITIPERPKPPPQGPNGRLIMPSTQSNSAASPGSQARPKLHGSVANREVGGSALPQHALKSHPKDPAPILSPVARFFFEGRA
jgi:hypothetical protein